MEPTRNHPASGRRGQWRQERADEIARGLMRCLRDLDSIEEGVAAAHVSMALELLRQDYRLDATD